MKALANGLSLPDLDTLAALETGRRWTPVKHPSEPLYRPAVNNGYWAEDIITNGLVLYVPLWLYSGAKFPSIDTYKHTGTVVGTTWGPQGRLWGSTEGYITISAFPLAGTVLTLELWLNTIINATHRQTIIGDGQLGVASGFIWVYRAENTNHLRYLYTYDTSNTYVAAANFFSGYDSQWLHLAIVCDYGNNLASFYRNGALFNSPSMQSGSVFPTPSRTRYIGQYDTGFPHYLDTAQVGEVRLYSRGLTAAEILHNYRATRWRYA